MLKPVKKINEASSERKKREAESQDKFLEKSFSIEHYILNHGQVLKKYGGLLAILIVIVFAYIQYKKSNEQEANARFGIAMIDYNLGNLDDAEKKLNDVKSEFSGTDAANRASYLLGRIYLEKGMLEAARQEFLSYEGNDPIFKSAKLAGLAFCFERDKKYQKAAELFEEAAEEEQQKERSIDYYISAAINYELSKNNAKAKAIFEDLIRENKSFSKKSFVEQKIESLSF